MDNRKFACMAAAAFLGVTLTAGATNALAGPRDVVVEGQRIDPKLQRKVFYHDLNIAERAGQKMLKARIYRTADSLCFDLNGPFADPCTADAVRSTDTQVADAIYRAERRMAGLSVGPPVAIAMVIGVQ